MKNYTTSPVIGNASAVNAEPYFLTYSETENKVTVESIGWTISSNTDINNMAIGPSPYEIMADWVHDCVQDKKEVELSPGVFSFLVSNYKGVGLNFTDKEHIAEILKNSKC